MRPKSPHIKDPIDRILDQSWEQPPDSLEEQLLAIPHEALLESARVKDRISVILNSIIMFWLMGLGLFYWKAIESMMLSLSRSLVAFTSISPQLLAEPLVTPVVLCGLLAMWVWFDLQKPLPDRRYER